VLEPLNLTGEVVDAIRAHTWKIDPPPSTPEGYLCRFADRIAYLTHDALDALRAGVVRSDDLPASTLAMFGEPGSDWIATMIRAVVDESLRTGRVEMAPETLAAMHELRDFMFEKVYLRADSEHQRRWAIGIIRDLVDHYLDHPDDIPESYRHDDADPSTQVIDYVSGMTDRFAIRDHDRLFRPDGVG
jgi:dGTPase